MDLSIFLFFFETEFFFKKRKKRKQEGIHLVTFFFMNFEQIATWPTNTSLFNSYLVFFFVKFHLFHSVNLKSSNSKENKKIRKIRKVNDTPSNQGIQESLFITFVFLSFLKKRKIILQSQAKVVFLKKSKKKSVKWS